MSAALETTGPGDPPQPDAETQLALLPDMRAQPETGDSGRQEPEFQAATGERTRGRPPGSRNKRTAEMVRYITSRYGSPLERLAQIYSADPHCLALTHGIKVAEALDLMKSAAIAALPYIEQKRPVAVDLAGKGTLQLIIGDIGQADPDDALEHGFSLDLACNVVDEESEQNQGVSETGDEKSDDGKSYG